ncbi:MAG: matrixin family metalloprotease [Acidobacteria bacterium]|nr:matrixin family metalloprotease [Acidobacteriota bacterium]
MLRLLLIAALLPLTACGGSPSAPSTTDPQRVLDGLVVSALDGAAGSGVSVQVGRERVTTDASGFFRVEIEEPGVYPVVARGSAFVERDTSIMGPSDTRARVSLIPTRFDLQSFDEMFRTTHSRLQRWTTRPSLVVLATVMNYRGASGDEFSASGEQLTDDEVTQMTDHLKEGLALLTGNTFTSFAEVQIERHAPGERVTVARSGFVVVGRYNGIVTFARTIGYGSWSELSDGTIEGGSIFLDRDFDHSDNRRRLLRIHELGHALGYQHVTSRTSIMNPAIGPEPTDADRAGAVIAFQRPPGNRSPDVDPSSSARTLATVGGQARWVSVFCR